jgi:dCMP deaminase
MIINAGIERIVFEEGYADALAKEMLKESGIEVERFNREQKAAGRGRRRIERLKEKEG